MHLAFRDLPGRPVLVAGSVVLGHAAAPRGVVHGHVGPQLVPLLRPLLRVLLSVVQPNSAFNSQITAPYELQHYSVHVATI